MILQGTERYQMQVLAYWYAEIPRRFRRRRNDRLKAPDGARANRRMARASRCNFAQWSWYFWDRVRRTDPRLWMAAQEPHRRKEVALSVAPD